MLAETPVLIDACVLINLVASGRLEEIAAALAPTRLVCRAAREESLFLRPVEPGAEPIPIDLGGYFDRGILTLADLEVAEEERRFVAYASELDDGEAMGLALARARKFGLATDDKKARRMAGEAGVRVFTTPEILHAWGDLLPAATLGSALRGIEDQARFRPSRDPLGAWWRAAVLR